jgi:hypothetical protein
MLLSIVWKILTGNNAVSPPLIILQNNALILCMYLLIITNEEYVDGSRTYYTSHRRVQGIVFVLPMSVYY